MKTNKELHESIGFQTPAQKTWYLAHVLMSGLTASPAIVIRSATPAIVGKRFVLGYAGFAGSFPVLAGVNTSGQAAGTTFPGRPAVAAIPASDGYAAVAAIPALPPSVAYPAGTAIPAYPFVPTRLEQALIIPAAARPEIKTPEVKPLPGMGNMIHTEVRSDLLTITAFLPVYAGVGLVGSNKLVIGEITPPALQASAFVQALLPSSGTQSYECREYPEDTTLEQVFYRMAKLCPHTETEVIYDIAGTVTNCRQLVVTLYPKDGFDVSSDDLQLALVTNVSSSGYGY